MTNEERAILITSNKKDIEALQGDMVEVKQVEPRVTKIEKAVEVLQVVADNKKELSNKRAKILTILIALAAVTTTILGFIFNTPKP